MGPVKNAHLPWLLRWVVVVTMTGSLAACANDVPTRSRPSVSGAPRGDCVFFEISTGQRVCVLTEPQAGTVERELEARGGVRVESLGNPLDTSMLPSRVDLREQGLAGCLQVRNQGECGWCAGHAAVSALDALYCVEGCPSPRASIPHLWSNGHMGTIGDCGPGWYLHEALDTATSAPLVPESDWAFANGARAINVRRPSNAQLMMNGRYRATGYTMIANWGPQPSDKLERIKAALASGRAVPVASGICFNGGWFSGTSVIDVPPSNCNAAGNGPHDGHHAYLLVGYDDTTGEFLALNSWGTGWGDGGYVRLTTNFVRQEIYAAGYFEDIDRNHGGCDVPDGGVPDAGVAAETDAALDASSDAGSTAPGVDARCASIARCDECAATTGCMHCGDRCVAANATRTAPQDGSACASPTTSPSSCAPTPGRCTTHLDCETCASNPTCAWCHGRCVSWPADSAICHGSRVATRSNQCNDVLGRCETAPDCQTCLMRDGCGWCEAQAANIHATSNSRCVGGTDIHSDRASCVMGWYGPTAMCPMPDAGVDAGTSNVPDAGGQVLDAGGPTADSDTCVAAQQTCNETTRCCGSLVCSAGVCCGLPSSECRNSDDCCPGIECVAGRCQCRQSGESCRETRDCCGSDVCRDGTCQRP